MTRSRWRVWLFTNFVRLWAEREENGALVNVIIALLGIGLGGLAALMITRGVWLLALFLVFFVPAGVFLHQYPFAAFLGWFLLMPLLPFKTVSSRVFWVVHRALIPGALGLTIVARMLRVKRTQPVRFGWAELSMAIYLVAGGVSVILTRSEPMLYIYELYDRMLVPFAAYLLMRLLPLDRRAWTQLLIACLILCIIEVGVGFWGRYAPQTLPSIWDIVRMGTRMSGTFDNPTPYAYTLAFCMVLIFYAAMNGAQGGLRLFLIFVFVMGLLCIFLTFTRGCWGAMALVFLGLMIMYPKPILSLLLVSVPVIAVLSVSVFATEMAFATKRLGTQDTVDSRIVLSHAGEQMFYARPIFGWGFGNYDRYDWQFMERVGNAAPTHWDIKYGTSHNTYLTILAEMGVIGFFFQFFPFFWWFKQTLQAWPRLRHQKFKHRKLLIGLWLTVLFYLVASQVVDMRFFWFHIGLLWASLGLIGNLVRQTQPSDLGRPQRALWVAGRRG